jgi:hypothetical protein
MKYKIGNENRAGTINCPKENMQIKQFTGFHTTKIDYL